VRQARVEGMSMYAEVYPIRAMLYSNQEFGPQFYIRPTVHHTVPSTNVALKNSRSRNVYVERHITINTSRPITDFKQYRIASVYRYIATTRSCATCMLRQPYHPPPLNRKKDWERGTICLSVGNAGIFERSSPMRSVGTFDAE